MFGPIMGLAAVAIALTGFVLSFGFARGYVRRRLRFVDAVRSPLAPYVAAVIAALLVAPLTIVPVVKVLVTGLTAAVVGVGAGLGTRSGVKALQRGDVG